MSLAAASLGSLSGAWAFPLHGGEIDSINLRGKGVVRALGSAGIFSSFIFLIMFFGVFVKITSTPLVSKENIKSEADVNADKLSRGTKKTWGIMRILVYFCMIFGCIVLFLTSMVNEGFVRGTDKLLLSVLIFGLGGTALTLTFIIGMLIVEWPKTKNPKGGKHATRQAEDNKLYRVIKPTRTLGIMMSIFFLLPVITILATEIDENLAVKAQQGPLDTF
tara:strand:+ start:233 stop:892 length:660 start_codon:yes stop_codon:yes gene_type:complete